MPARLRAERGFTLVELLVVVIVLGILAAVAVPVLSRARDAAADAQTTATLAIARAALVAYRADDHDGYTDDVDALDRYGYPPAAPVAVGTPRLLDDDAAFCIDATASTGNPFHATDRDAPAPGLC